MIHARDLLIKEANSSLLAAQKRLDRYENLLVGHISGLKSLESDLSDAVKEAVNHYRSEVATLRIVYLEALRKAEDLEAAPIGVNDFKAPQTTDDYDDSDEKMLVADEEDEEEEMDGPPSIL